jgi:hypothetical protein
MNFTGYTDVIYRKIKNDDLGNASIKRKLSTALSGYQGNISVFFT